MFKSLRPDSFGPKGFSCLLFVSNSLLYARQIEARLQLRFKPAFQSLVFAFAVYCVSLLVILGGAGAAAFINGDDISVAFDPLFVSYDSFHYMRIVDNGYSYDPERQSEVAFFPGYPIAGFVLKSLFRLETANALRIVSNVCFLCVLWMIDYFKLARPFGDAAESKPIDETGKWDASRWAVVILGLYAPAIFMRMAYSEAMFLLVVTGAFTCVRANRIWAAALLIGLASGIRPVGIGLILGCWFAGYRRQNNVGRRIMELLVMSAICSVGVIAYATYLGWKFNAPLAFVHAQRYWSKRDILILEEKLFALSIAEPIWSVYTPGCACFWRDQSPQNPFLNIWFQNPLIYVAVIAMVIVAKRSKWIEMTGFLFAFGLLAIPYLTRSYEWCMNSHARFTCVILPFYLAVGCWMQKQNLLVRWLALTLLATWLASYAAMFALGLPVF